ncbi:ferrochelatase [Brooklawnia cerclae]|uniref:Coproporphyrin III ferrochelatase n=1 Tax=Brooklawnia cerclae TaxID=349934 RepID=A0ABX0SFR6_9ACTN|nr:ferrochelatase [Brooklawnia cerclae]NIH55522.1 ferrochelatase [Brooklawnia cerclae]
MTDDAALYDAVVMLGFGGPEHPDDVLGFLERVTAGRGIPPERLAEVGRHYFIRGGTSPINAQNRAMRDALAERLAARGVGIDLVLANRNSPPFVADVLADLARQGRTRLLAWATAAYSSYSSCRQYREDLGMAVEQLDGTHVDVVKMPPFPDLPGLVEANIDLLAEVLRQTSGSRELLVLATTHSLPTALAATAGPEAGRSGGDLYTAQQRALVERVVPEAAARAGLAVVPEWRLVYQSRSGAPHVPWLEPDVNDAIGEAAGAGVTDVVILPVGFLTDHVEVSWDLDTQARQTAEGLGVTTHRVPTVGAHPAFLDSLADLLAAYATNAGRAPGPGELCRGDCCLNPRIQRPVADAVHLP